VQVGTEILIQVRKNPADADCMKKVFSAGIILLLTISAVLADDPAIPLNVTSGFNANVIASGSGSAGDSTSSEIDSTHSVFYDGSYAASHGNLSGAFPAGQTVTDASGNQYSLAPATGNNALLIGYNNPSGILNLSYATNAALTSLLLLGTSVDGGTILDYTLNFANGDTLDGTLTFADWHDYGGDGVFTGLGHVTTADAFSGNASLYALNIAIPLADQTATLENISFTYDSGNANIDGIAPTAAIFGVSAFDPIIATPEPTSMGLAICGATVLGFLARRKNFKN
jgi:hypothetical protein